MKEKAIVKKVGKLQHNARIDIDYTGDKPTIKYSYVSRGKYHDPAGDAFILPALILSFLIIGTVALFFYLNSHVYFSDCSVLQEYDQINGTKYGNITAVNHIWINCTDMDNETYVTKMVSSESNMEQLFFQGTPKNDPSMLDSFKYSLYDTNRFAFLMILWAITVIPFILLCRKLGPLLINLFPKSKSFFKRQAEKQAERFAKDVGTISNKYVFRKCPENNIIEIPVFKNQYMDYNATDEFSDYLQFIRIREHPFYVMCKKKGKIKWKINDCQFYCRFYFSKNPRKGKLEVRWK